MYSPLNTASTLLRDISALFLPDLCLLCNRPLEAGETYVCPRCWASLTVFPDRTARPYRALRGELEWLWIGWAYEARVRRIIHLLKYDRRPEVADLLVREWLRAIPHLDAVKEMDLLLPVPIHPARRRWRGVNQSERLAEALGRALDLPVEYEAVRLVNTPSQTLLSRPERFRSLEGAFRLPSAPVFRGKRVAVVDDLATSGATLAELARRLREAGAAGVSAAVMTSPETGLS
ncbi:MAG: ComF family protein [Candidatus Zixiibacteriota bacterium]|nr:MAG: ComF family protein [candidate division Zixibacteria bacterium]